MEGVCVSSMAAAEEDEEEAERARSGALGKVRVLPGSAGVAVLADLRESRLNPLLAGSAVPECAGEG